jgi:hypothetical protein
LPRTDNHPSARAVRAVRAAVRAARAAVTVAVLTACSDLPTGSRRELAATRPDVSPSAPAVLAELAGVRDARDRVVPALRNPSAAALRAALETLSARLAGPRDPGALRAATAAAEAAVATYAQAAGRDPGSAADVDAIRLALAALTSPGGSRR